MTGTVLTPFDHFNADLDSWRSEIAEILPAHIDSDRFITTARVSIRNNPSLLKASPKSMREAVTEAAEDGLLPDGREGVITLYGEDAQWNPMVYGIRKRAKEIAGIIIDAQVVREGDHFVWHQGDDPRIEHTPAALGTKRGPLVGVYAIFRQGSTILHREVMDREQVETARNQNRGWAKSLLWTKFETEGWRKTAIRRGIKTVPSVADLERIVGREDRNYSFAPAPRHIVDVPPIDGGVLRPAANKVPSPDAPPHDQPDEPPPEPSAEEPAEEPEKRAANAPPKDQAKPATDREKFASALAASETPTALNAIWAAFEKKFKSAADRDWATDQFEHRYNALTGG